MKKIWDTNLPSVLGHLATSYIREAGDKIMFMEKLVGVDWDWRLRGRKQDTEYLRKSRS